MANWAGSAIDGLLCYCRAGFEPELAGELTERAAQAGFAGYARTERNTGHVLFVCDDADALSRSLPWSTLIFARQKLRLFADLAALDPRDRIAPMLAALPADIRYGELVMEHPDSILEKSRMSLMMTIKASPDERIVWAQSSCSAVRGVSSNQSVMPRTPFMGVRIS